MAVTFRSFSFSTRAALPGVLAEDHLAVTPDDLRLQRLVRQRVGEHPVGVDPRLVAERIVPDERLVRRDRDARKSPRRAGKARRAARSGSRGHLVQRFERHDDLFERSVPRPLAEAVDADVGGRDPDLARGERVRDREAEVVVAVDRPVGRTDPSRELFQVPAERERGHDPDRVGEDEPVGAGVLDLRIEALHEVERGPDRVLGHERDVESGVLRLADGRERGRDDLVLGHLQLVPEMDLARRDEDRDVRGATPDHGVDVPRHRAGRGEDLRREPGAGDPADRRRLVRGNDGNSGVDHGDSDVAQDGGDPELLLRREVDARHLFAVAERLVPELDRLREPSLARGGRVIILDELPVRHRAHRAARAR